MKKLCMAFLALTVLISCDNPVSKKIKETKEGVVNTTKAVKEITSMQEDIEALQQIDPLTNEELKAWLPEEINGMKRTAYKAGQTAYMQIASVDATYSSEDKSKIFKVQVIDGAGQMGAAATAGMRMVMSQDFEEEDEYKTRRSVMKNGNKAIEEYRKGNNNSEIQFMQGNRFYITAKGTNMSLDELWEAIEKLQPEDLG